MNIERTIKRFIKLWNQDTIKRYLIQFALEIDRDAKKEVFNDIDDMIKTYKNTYGDFAKIVVSDLTDIKKKHEFQITNK